jgi:hypothetical protein
LARKTTHFHSLLRGFAQYGVWQKELPYFFRKDLKNLQK